MNKKTRVSLLVFTIVAALAAFSALWYTRPGAPSYVLEEAKARQNMPLLEVQEPAIQTPPIEINLDYKAISAKVKESLVADDGFSDVMAKSVSSSAATLIDKKLDSFTTEIDSRLSKQSADLIDKVDLKIQDNNQTFMTLVDDGKMYQSQIDAVNNKLIIMNSRIEKNTDNVNEIENYSIDISKYIPQIVDAVLPEVTQSVLMSVEDNKDILFGDIYSESNDGVNTLSNDQFEAVYARYRASIVKDITNEILDNIEAQVMKDFDVKSENTEDNVIIPSKPTFSSSASTDVVEKTPYIKSNTISIIATSDGSNIQSGEKDLSQTVNVPTFEKKPEITVIDPVEYDEKRTQIREDAINDILKLIK